MISNLSRTEYMNALVADYGYSQEQAEAAHDAMLAAHMAEEDAGDDGHKAE